MSILGINKTMSMKIVVTSVFVENQDKALKFYTEKLGFLKKQDFPVGEFKWLAVVSSEDRNATELLLEPNDNPVAKEYQKGLVAQGIPATSFGVADIEDEHKRLKGLGVKFTMKPTQMGHVKVAVFDDTCGNLIQIAER
jgi:catechol 2,3-dioxygenase-like lactoylglutathione lyase family enzyme